VDDLLQPDKHGHQHWGQRRAQPSSALSTSTERSTLPVLNTEV
jgi:hypothetical protein